jgi:hypothetical protein
VLVTDPRPKTFNNSISKFSFGYLSNNVFDLAAESLVIGRVMVANVVHQREGVMGDAVAN